MFLQTQWTKRDFLHLPHRKNVSSVHMYNHKYSMLNFTATLTTGSPEGIQLPYSAQRDSTLQYIMYTTTQRLATKHKFKHSYKI